MHCRPYCTDGSDDICGMEQKTITSKTVWPNLHELRSSFSCLSHIITLKIWSHFIAPINNPLLNNTGQEETMTRDSLQFEGGDSITVLKGHVHSPVEGKILKKLSCVFVRTINCITKDSSNSKTSKQKITKRLNSGNACQCSLQNLMSSRILLRNLKKKMINSLVNCNKVKCQLDATR